MTSLSKTISGAKRPLTRKMKLPPIKEIESEVSRTGNGAHVFVPKGWMGKKVKVSLLDD